MRLLVDTDAFCKLAVADLFAPALSNLDVDRQACGRLASLPHMLRRGRLRSTYGGNACDTLALLAEVLPVAEAPDSALPFIEDLAQQPSIDPGEALLFATGAALEILVLTGDKRAVRSLSSAPNLAQRLSGRVITVEAVLIMLCNCLGVDKVRRCIAPLAAVDTAVAICFREVASDPRAGLESYFRDLADDVKPMTLWEPEV